MWPFTANAVASPVVATSWSGKAHRPDRRRFARCHRASLCIASARKESSRDADEARFPPTYSGRRRGSSALASRFLAPSRMASPEVWPWLPSTVKWRSPRQACCYSRPHAAMPRSPIPSRQGLMRSGGLAMSSAHALYCNSLAQGLGHSASGMLGDHCWSERQLATGGCPACT